MKEINFSNVTDKLRLHWFTFLTTLKTSLKKSMYLIAVFLIPEIYPTAAIKCWEKQPEITDK